MVFGRKVKCVQLGIVEQLILQLRQLPSFSQPPLIVSCSVQFQQGRYEKCIIVQIGSVFGSTLSPCSQQVPIRISQMGQQEIGRLFGGRGILGAIQFTSADSQRLDHQSVPCGQHLVIQ